MTSSTTHARGARFLGTQLLWKADYRLQNHCRSVTTAITPGILQARGGKRVRADTVCADDDTAGRKKCWSKRIRTLVEDLFVFEGAYLK